MRKDDEPLKDGAENPVPSPIDESWFFNDTFGRFRKTGGNATTFIEVYFLNMGMAWKAGITYLDYGGLPWIV